MAEKTPRELLRESLEHNARELEKWPDWMRRAASTESLFSVPSRREREPSYHDASPVTEPSPKG
jgi:hypothetical protein